MSNSSFKVRKGVVVIPEGSPSLTEQGELKYDSAADELLVRGASATDAVVQVDKAQTLTNKTIDGDDNTVQDLALSSLKTELADADKVLQRDAAGVVVSGPDVPVGSVELVDVDVAQTLTNKTIDADLNTITNIENADIKALAAIDATKLADGSVSNTEFQYLANVTSDIQSQLDDKVDGPASSVDNTLPRYDGTTGKLLQGSAVVVSDSDEVSGVSRLDVDNLRLDGNTLSSTDTNGDVVLDPNGTGSVAAEAQLRLPEIATPATPASGYGNIYFKTDGKLYQQNDAGLETEVGSGNSIVTINTTENIAIRQLVSINSNGEAELSEAFEHGQRTLHLGFAVAAATTGNPVQIQTSGIMGGFSGLSIGKPVYIDSLTPGAYSQPTDETGPANGQIQAVPVGVAISATEINIKQPSVLLKDKMLLDVNTNFAALLSQEYAMDSVGGPNPADYWIAYNDGGTQPVDGSGGTPTAGMEVTKGVDGAVPRFALVKPASNVQGEGWSGNFRIGSEDRARVMEISFDYIAEGNYANNDVTVWIIPSSGALIQPSVYQISRSPGSSSYSSFKAQFQTDAIQEGYKLAFHVSSTNASSFTILVKNLKIRRQQAYVAPALQDLGPYTPTISNLGTVTNVYASAIKVGSKLRVQGYFTGGIGAASPATFSLPSGLTIATGDTGFRPGSNYNAVGIASIDSQANDIDDLQIIAKEGDSEVYFAWRSSSSSDNLTPQNGNAFGSLSLSIQFEVPIAGWGANTTILGAEAARTVVFSAQFTASQIIADATFAQLTLDAVQDDTHAAKVGNTYRIPVSGRYELYAAIEYTANGTGARAVYIETSPDNSTWTVVVDQAVKAVGGGPDSVQAFKPLYLAAGTYVRVSTFQNSGIAIDLSATVTRNNFSVTRIAGPEAIGAGEIVEAKANTTGTSYNSSGQTILWSNKEYDSHNALNIGTGVYTAPRAGTLYCSVSAVATAVAAAVTDSDFIILQYNDGSGWVDYQEVAQFVHQTASSISPNMKGSISIKVQAGWQIRLKAQASYGGTSLNSGSNNHWSIWMS